MNTNEKGAIAEHKVIVRAIEKGFVVSKPVIDARYDLILDDGDRIFRVQVKYSDRKSSNSTGAVVIDLRCRDGSANRAGQVDRALKMGRYTEVVDMILVYLPKIDRIINVPKEMFGKPGLVVRYEPAQNGQKKGMNFITEWEW